MRVDFLARKRDFNDVPSAGVVLVHAGGQVCFGLKAMVNDEASAGLVLLSGPDSFTLIDPTVPRGALLSLDGVILRPSLDSSVFDLQGDDGPQPGQLCLAQGRMLLFFQDRRRLNPINLETGILEEWPELRDRLFINAWSVIQMVDDQPIALLEHGMA